MNANTGNKVVFKKPKKNIRVKSFRLLDFHTFDDRKTKTESSSDDDSVDSGPKKNTSQFMIQMFAVNEQGETCCIYLNDYTPFFYVKVGDDWTPREVNAFKNEICRTIGQYHGSSIISAELIQKHKLYGFSAGKLHNFVKLQFSNLFVMNKVKNLWFEYTSFGRKLKPYLFPPKNGIPLELYESSIPPVLRYFHIHNISPSGWVYIPVDEVMSPDMNTTTCTYEYICSVQQVKPMPHKETRVPYKICSFDIEASSSHGDFPVPKKTYKKLATNIIDCFANQMACQELDKEYASKLLQKIILTAFGMDRFNDIDTVYPKQPVSKEFIKKSIQTLIETSIDKLLKRCRNNSEFNDLFKIDEMFEEIQNTHYHSQYNISDYMNGDGDDEDAADNAADDENNDSDNEDNDPVPSKKPKAKPILKTEKNTTIVDMLLNTEYKRDDKLQVLNQILSNAELFPGLEGDKVTFIGSTFIRYGEIEPYLNHCLVLGSCDPVDGVVIETTDHEKELLLNWATLIQNESPDIIIGYNIFGFDYTFMFERAKELHCERDFLKLSRKMGEICGNENKEGILSIENTKIQLASGEYDLRYPKISGRLQLDMYAYLRRDFNLSSYKLDDVAGNFISDDIKKIEHVHDESYGGNITKLYSQNITGLHKGDFIHIELSSFTSDYYKNGQKFKVLDIIRNFEIEEMVKGKLTMNKYNIILIQNHEHIDQSKTVKWGMAKDDVSPQDIFRLSNGSAADRAIVAKYCVQDCNLVHHLMNKIDVITGYVEMSRICSVPISFLIFRGQGIKLTSYVAKKCSDKNTLMPDLEKSGGNEGYEGAIVLPPKCSMYMDNPVACVDYASLYPSSMISQNFSHDSKVWMKEYNLRGQLIKETGDKDASGNYIYDHLPGYQYIDIEFDNFKYLRNPNNPVAKAEKTKVGKIVCRWAQFPENKKGIMPSILEELLKARADTRKMIKTEKDPFMQNILDKRQLGYKVTANSLYGQCGAKTSTFYEKDVAASTTATGRMMITYAKRIIEEVYGNYTYNTLCHGPVVTKAEYVYGDTDSVFFTFNLEDIVTGEKIRGKKALEITIEIAQDAAKLCTQWLKAPMELTYEKTLMPFILLSKKRYVGMLYETDPNKCKMKYMGLSIKRRDSCDYLKDTYGGILTILMKEKENNIQKAIEFLNQSLNYLIEGQVSMDKLTITKALRSDYKNPNQIAHKVLADRIGQRDPGNKPKSGERIQFVHIVSKNKKALQGEKIETPEFIIQNKIKIDYTFYITNQLMKPLQQLFGLALEEIFNIDNQQNAIKQYKKDLTELQKKYDGIEEYMKKREKYCSNKIKNLLFDKYLMAIYNKENSIRPITNYFSAR